MKLREFQKKVNLDLFHYDLRVVVTNDVYASRAKRNYLFGEFPDQGKIRGLHTKNGEGLSYIFLFHDADIGEICHEAFHCIWSIHEYTGAKFENEIVAYTLAHLVRNIAETLVNYRVRAKRK